MCVDTPAAADGHILWVSHLPKVSRLVASATNRFRNSAGGDSPGQTQPTRRGAVRHSGAARITWRPRHLPIMCAEAVWWRCHRALIADGLRWAGFEVYHIMGLTASVPHPYTSAARIIGGLLSYAAPGAA